MSPEITQTSDQKSKIYQKPRIKRGVFPAASSALITTDSDRDTFDEKADLEMPMSYGFGMAYRFSDTFTAAFDIYRTEWDDFILRRKIGLISPITYNTPNLSNIEETIQVRFGWKKLLIRPSCVIPLRGGLFFTILLPHRDHPMTFTAYPSAAGMPLAGWHLTWLTSINGATL